MCRWSWSRTLLWVIAASGLVGCHFRSASTRGSPPTLRRGDGTEYLAHEVIVHVAPGTSSAALEAALARVGGRLADDESPGSPGGLRELGYHRVDIPESLTADVAISELAQDGSGVVLNAEANYLVQAFATPNDTRFGELWGMAKISAPAAWDIGTGSPSVLVAVSDTGIDYTHPDLAANVWKNPGEIPGNGKDDDGNGYVDDVYGYDFANGDGDPMDDHGHGTHVSGTIGAVANNSLGVAGLNWNVRILGAKFLSASGSGTSWNGAQSILYAAKMKARVVNASWGCLGSGCYASYIEDALRALDQAGGIFVAAAGNNGSNNDVTPTYPAGYVVPNVIAVAATDSNDELASFSNYGATKVHLAAPGVGILSTLAGGGYASWSGTSMATPHVAGAAALMAALRPDASPEEIKQKLMDSTDPVAGLGGKMVSGGRLNVRKLLASAGRPPSTPAGLDGHAGGHSDVLLSWNASPETDVAQYRVQWGTTSGVYTVGRLDVGKDVTSARVPGLLNGTRYFFVVTAVNAAGAASAPTAELAVVALDTVAPGQVLDLAARPLPGAQALGELVGASGEFSPVWSASNAVDGSPDTAWISPGRQVSEEESLTLALLAPVVIDSVDLLPNAAYPGFFPLDFDVETSLDGETWITAGGARGASATAGMRVRVAFSPTLAAEVRLRVLRSVQHASGIYYTSIAEMTVNEASSAPDALALTFTAPGDDVGEGRAQRYDVRRASTPLTEASFDGAAAVAAPGQPLAAGLPEALTVSGLAGESTFFFAMKAIDEAGNRSPMSNVASATTLLIPPSTITDLRVSTDAADAGHPGMVVLLWTAPGGDGKSGQARAYDLRFVDGGPAPTAGDFAGATPVPGVPAPAVAGSQERFAVSGLAPGHAYAFALRAIDGAGATGGISNIVRTTPSGGDDHTPPATIRELDAVLSNASVKVAATVDSVSDELSAGRSASHLVDGDVASAWMTQAATSTTPAWVVLDLGAVMPLVRFRANPSTADLLASYPQDFQIQGSADKVNWTSIVSVAGLTGKVATWNAWASPVTNARYVRLYITRRGPAPGNAVYAAMGEFEIYALTPAIDADLTWVAPGDDGYDGTAAAYDMRQSTVLITDASFAAAAAVPTLSPLAGGMIEVLHLASVPLESTVYFAVKAVDDNGNWGALSNVASLTSPGMSPAAVGDLALVRATTATVTLGFTASGDDGNAGTATSYDLRYSTSPLNPATWAAATPVAGLAAPRAAGSAEQVVVGGLAPTTLYYFGLVVVDDVGNRSLLSNVLVASTRDGTPPDAIRDLVATPVDPAQRPPLALTISDSSGSFSAATAPKNLLDATDTTVWMSPDLAQAPGGSGFVQLDLGGQRRLGRLRLRAGAIYRDLFPVDFRLEVQAQTGGAWTVVVRESGFVSQPSVAWEEWMLGSVPAVAARLVVTKANPWTGRFIAALGDLELYEDPTDFSKLRLAWTATGDDGARGAAVRYDLRRAPTPIAAADFASAAGVTLPALPTPQTSGSLERYEASGLAPETQVCFAIEAIDDAGNASAASNSPCATTPGIPPATITDLVVSATTAGTATLTFTAPGADGNVGQASAYEIRRATTRLNTTTWGAATAVAAGAAPRAAGTMESITVSGLSGLTTYTFAVRAIDAGGNVAPISNNASGTTLDDIAPAAVADLAASTNAAQGGSLTLTWTAPGDNGPAGQAKRYDVRVSMATITAASFSAATPVSVAPPAAGGARESATVTGLAAESAYYVALETIDAAGNTSPLSNVAAARTREEAPSAITDLAVVGGTGRAVGAGTLILQWTAPGDDGALGTARAYEIRYSTGTITAATFAAASLAAAAPTPAAAGTRQSFTLGGLAVGAKYTIAIETADDRGNLSGLSNVATSTTPDEVPPATTGDLRAATGTAPGTLSLTLTAPGDDGGTGRATAYDVRFSAGPIDAGSFSAATAVTGTPAAPAVAGASQTFTVSGLPNETIIHVALRTRDDAGNWSAVSNDASAATLNVPPAAITDLRLLGRGTGSFTLGWTATGDDGKAGTAVAYELRYAEAPLTEANFAAATAVPTPPPAGAGSAQSASVAGLAANKTLYFAIRARDDQGNASPLSNVLAAATDDTVAPGAIVLVATTGATAGAITLSWTATGDDGNVGTATRYELRHADSPIDVGNWSLATPVPAVGAPRPAGLPETTTATGLKGESTHHFAIRAFDEAGNGGPVSNDAAADTLPVPPAAVTLTATLAVSNGVASVTLAWAAPGDDGMQGQATAYDLRSSTATLSASNFAAATPVAAPTPAAAGTVQSVVIPNLRESTTYAFALKSVDDTHTWSDLSNVATVKVPDLTKPGAPAALSVGVPDVKGKPIAVSKVTASSVLGPAWDSTNAVDGDATSSWASAGADAAAAESLLFDLGTAQSIERIKLTPDAKYLELFPRGFSLAVSADNRTFKTLVTESGYRVGDATPLTWGFPAEAARYVRLAVDDTGVSFGKHYAIVADAEIDGASATDGEAQLTWLAPGDDGYAGTAARYDVFRSTRAFTEADLGAVTAVSGAPAPLPSGSLQTMTLTGLHGETTYFWALRAVDEAGNVGPLSVVTPGKTNDVPPAAVRDLSGSALGGTSILLRWTATGDDGTEGTAQSTEIRYLSAAAGSLGATTFAQAALVPGLPAPAPARTAQSVTVTGLSAGVLYRFALVAKDAAGNPSYLSNVAAVTTDRPADRTPPSAVTDLTVAIPAVGGKVVGSGAVTAQSSEQAPDFKAARAADGDLDSFWASAPRATSEEEWIRVSYPGPVTADRVRLWPAVAYPDLFPPDVQVRVSPDGLAWTTVATETGIAASAGNPVMVALGGSRTLKYVEIRATRLAHHASGMFYAVLAEVELLTASEPPGTAVASFTAPADDGASGNAAAYDLRAGTCPFDAARATAVATAAPGDAGTPERFRIAGLPSGQVCVSIASRDDAGNVSGWSNVASVTLP